MFVYRMVFWEDPKLSQVCVCVRVCVCVCGVFFRSPTSQEKQELVAETWCKEGPVKKNGCHFSVHQFERVGISSCIFSEDHINQNTAASQLPSRPCWVQ